ncbi:MAG: sigma-54 interaction domain-containing protein [Alphaproteobacteria bacterium]
MENILIVKESFDNINDLEKFFSSKNLTFKILGSDELNQINSPKSVLICNKRFEESVKGKSSLLKLARNIGSTKIIILNSDTNENYNMDSEMGGSFVNIGFKEMDEVIKEIIFQEISIKKYSFSDSKTVSLIKIAEKVASTDVTVFIHGPTGTGKEVISNYIHQKSERSENPFIAVNCAAIPENMLEAMLFGHEKGAFTGASSANKGIFRAADTGTLLLDEISEMPLSLQAKLLRVLQEKKVTPIGGQRDIDVDVRVIATTNRNMINEVREKKFREDLYYRLNVFPIGTLNLSERKDDIIPISVALLKRHSEKSNLPYIDKSAQNIIKNYVWPGNVRELENVLQRAIVLCDNNVISEKDIMIDLSEENNFFSNTDENINNQKVLQA